LLGGLAGGDLIESAVPIGSVGLLLMFVLGIGLAVLAIRAPGSRAASAIGVTDGISGLYLEGHGDELVSRLVARDDRSGQSATTLVVIRVDLLEQLIARYGREIVDVIVHAVGHLVRGQIRSTDIAVQLPGYRFGIYLHCGEQEQALAFGRRIAMLLRSQQIQWQGDEIKLTVSMVVAPRSPGEPLAHLKQRAVGQLDLVAAETARIERCPVPDAESGQSA
jgi:diguanylate cyclase (GGDEF)-like protein